MSPISPWAHPGAWLPCSQAACCEFRGSQERSCEDCDLYGCGTWGRVGRNSLGLQVINNLIHDCSHGGVKLMHFARTSGWTATPSENLGDEYGPGAVIRTSDCGNITIDGADGTTFSLRRKHLMDTPKFLKANTASACCSGSMSPSIPRSLPPCARKAGLVKATTYTVLRRLADREC